MGNSIFHQRLKDQGGNRNIVEPLVQIKGKLDSPSKTMLQQQHVGAQIFHLL